MSKFFDAIPIELLRYIFDFLTQKERDASACVNVETLHRLIQNEALGKNSMLAPSIWHNRKVLRRFPFFVQQAITEKVIKTPSTNNELQLVHQSLSASRGNKKFNFDLSDKDLRNLINTFPKNAILFKVLLDIDDGHLRKKLRSSPVFLETLIEKIRFVVGNIDKQDWFSLKCIMQDLNITASESMLKAFVESFCREGKSEEYMRYIFLSSLQRHYTRVQKNIIQFIFEKLLEYKFPHEPATETNRYAAELLCSMAKYGNDGTRRLIKDRLTINTLNMSVIIRNRRSLANEVVDILLSLAFHTDNAELLHECMDYIMSLRVESEENDDNICETYSMILNACVSVMQRRPKDVDYRAVLTVVSNLADFPKFHVEYSNSNYIWMQNCVIKACGAIVFIAKEKDAVRTQCYDITKKIIDVYRSLMLSSKKDGYSYDYMLKNYAVIAAYLPLKHDEARRFLKDVYADAKRANLRVAALEAMGRLDVLSKNEAVRQTIQDIIEKSFFSPPNGTLLVMADLCISTKLRYLKNKDIYKILVKNIAVIAFNRDEENNEEIIKVLALLLSQGISHVNPMLDAREFTVLCNKPFLEIQHNNKIKLLVSLASHIPHTKKRNQILETILNALVLLPFPSHALVGLAKTFTLHPSYLLSTSEPYKKIKEKVIDCLSDASLNLNDFIKWKMEALNAMIFLLPYIPLYDIRDLFLPKLMCLFSLVHLSFEKELSDLLVKIVALHPQLCEAITSEMLKVFNENGSNFLAFFCFTVRTLTQFIACVSNETCQKIGEAICSKKDIFSWHNQETIQRLVVSMIWVNEKITPELIPMKWKEDFLLVKIACAIKAHVQNEYMLTKEEFLKNLVQKIIEMLESFERKYLGCSFSGLFTSLFASEEKKQLCILRKQLQAFDKQKKYNMLEAEKVLSDLINSWLRVQQKDPSRVSQTFYQTVQEIRFFYEEYLLRQLDLPVAEESRKNSIISWPMPSGEG